MPRVFLSKSRIIYGLQCHKRLWLQVHRPDLVVYDASTQRRLDSGHLIGEYGRRLYGGGTLIAAERGSEALRQTERALREAGDEYVLYEPALRYAGVLIRADVLVRAGGRTAMIEVKGSAGVKQYHINDAAIQAWVLRGAGLPVDEVRLAHVDTGWVYPGAHDYHGLLVEEDVSEEVARRQESVWGWVDELRAVVAGPLPEIAVGPHCHDPFDCPLLPLCSADEPEFPVSLLPRGTAEAAALRAAGHDDLRDVPGGWPFSALHERVWRATVSGEAELDGAARRELLGLARPRFFLDFETIGFAVPVWAGTRPYEQLPFQFSLHVEAVEGALEQRSFLDTSGEPPMRRLAGALLEAVGDQGPVFVYSGYEHTCLQALARRFADLAPGLLALDARLVDLCEIAKRSYYHPAMKGSWSLKAVLPTVAPELDYEGLDEVHDGSDAQAAYLEAIDPQTDDERRGALRRALLDYCALDTLALVRLAGFLQESPPTV